MIQLFNAATADVPYLLFVAEIKPAQTDMKHCSSDEKIPGPQAGLDKYSTIAKIFDQPPKQNRLLI